MKIAQVVITKTQNGKWKITAMSLNEIELVHAFVIEHAAALSVLELMKNYEWEQLSLAV